MMYEAKVTVRSDSHTKHINEMQSDAEFFNVKPGDTLSNR